MSKNSFCWRINFGSKWNDVVKLFREVCYRMPTYGQRVFYS